MQEKLIRLVELKKLIDSYKKEFDSIKKEIGPEIDESIDIDGFVVYTSWDIIWFTILGNFIAQLGSINIVRCIFLFRSIFIYINIAIPNDAEYYSQWHMAPAGLDPHVYDAWDLETGSDSIKLGMIDSGVNYKHRDLEGNIWVNPGEDIDGDGVVYDIDDLNGVDDDGNGVVDDLIGYDFFTGISGGVYPGEDGGGLDTDPNDFSGHGTHCAGIATANGNVQGVAPGAYLLNGKVLDYSGVGYDSWIIRGIDWAIANGADIISMSLGTGARVVSQAINAAVDAAWEQGVFVVVAAGNDGPDPVSIGSPGMASRAFTVGAYDSNGGIADFSSVGASITDICDPDILAPGVDILSTASDHSYYVASGTSMATPAVAGAVALLKSAFPTVSNDLIRAALLATATPISKNRFTQGAGLVNVSKAYEYLQNPYPFIFPDFDSEHVLRLSAGEHFSYQLDVFLTDPSDTLSFSVSSNLQQFVSITTLDSATQGWIRAKVTLTMPDTEVDGTIYISNGTEVICQTSLVLRFDSHDYHPNDANSGTDAGETFGGSIAINLGDFVEGTLPIGDGDTFSLELTENHYYKLTLSKLTGFCRFEIYDANYEPIVYYIFSDFGVEEWVNTVISFYPWFFNIFLCFSILLNSQQDGQYRAEAE